MFRLEYAGRKETSRTQVAWYLKLGKHTAGMLSLGYKGEYPAYFTLGGDTISKTFKSEVASKNWLIKKLKRWLSDAGLLEN